MRMLKPEYRDVYNDFLSDYVDRGCSCHQNPPCSYCTHEGNPDNLTEDDGAWQEVDMEDIRVAPSKYEGEYLEGFKIVDEL